VHELTTKISERKDGGIIAIALQDGKIISHTNNFFPPEEYAEIIKDVVLALNNAENAAMKIDDKSMEQFHLSFSLQGKFDDCSSKVEAVRVNEVNIIAIIPKDKFISTADILDVMKIAAEHKESQE